MNKEHSNFKDLRTHLYIITVTLCVALMCVLFCASAYGTWAQEWIVFCVCGWCIYIYETSFGGTALLSAVFSLSICLNLHFQSFGWFFLWPKLSFISTWSPVHLLYAGESSSSVLHRPNVFMCGASEPLRA